MGCVRDRGIFLAESNVSMNSWYTALSRMKKDVLVTTKTNYWNVFPSNQQRSMLWSTWNKNGVGSRSLNSRYRKEPRCGKNPTTALRNWNYRKGVHQHPMTCLINRYNPAIAFASAARTASVAGKVLTNFEIFFRSFLEIFLIVNLLSPSSGGGEMMV